MNRLVNNLKKEYSLYSNDELVVLASKYFKNIQNPNAMTRNGLIERMVSTEVSNSYK